MVKRDVEAALQRRFMREARKNGLYVAKLVTPARRGWPDLLVISPMPHARVYWVELKTEDGELTMLQEQVHRELRAWGQRVSTLRGWAQMAEWIAEVA